MLAAWATAGLSELSGDWLYEVGLPGKSGVSGGLVTISPGKGALGNYSPPLDEAGNSVRGQFAARRLSTRLGMNLFTSAVAVPAESWALRWCRAGRVGRTAGGPGGCGCFRARAVGLP